MVGAKVIWLISITTVAFFHWKSILDLIGPMHDILRSPCDEILLQNYPHLYAFGLEPSNLRAVVVGCQTKYQIIFLNS